MTLLRAVLADITTLEVDAVVNAANAALAGGAGVDGAIHAAGGPEIMAECREVIARRGRLDTGDAVATTAGRLPARIVIHTVGPIWSGRDPDRQDAELASCYRRSLDVAVEHRVGRIAFPSISTGLYAFPRDRAADVALAAVRGWIDGAPDGSTVLEVVFACFSAGDLERYRARGVGE